MSFFKVFFATVLGFFTSLILIVLLAVGIVAALIASFGSENVVHVATRSVLTIDLSKSYPEHQAIAGLTDLARGGAGALSLRELVAAIDHAASDGRIAAIRLEASGSPGSWAAAEEIRRALEHVRAAGKPVIATIGQGGIAEGGYFVASAAQRIIAVPGSHVEMNGIAAVLPFVKPAMDRLGITAQVVRVGAFKSAVEPFTRDSASPETLLMTRELVDGTFKRFREVVAESRKIQPSALASILSTRGLMTAYEARSAGLVDDVLYEDQIDSVLRARTNRAQDDDVETISVTRYATAVADDLDDGTGPNQIAVVYAVGEITAGKSGTSPSPLGGGQTLGDETFREAMQTARDNKAIKAVVVRIDSPGGEAGPSEAMWREIRLTAARKPVIASMGATAASGGYFLAAACDSIVAEPTTVTGSIGVFGLWFTIREFLRETIGVNLQVIRSDSLADMGSMLRAPTDLERDILQRSVDSTYRKFLTIVSEGRGISLQEADRIGQGRVYTGARAKQLGLVDELGGLDRAVTIAAARAGLKKDGFRLRILPHKRSLFDSIAEMVGGDDESILAGGSLEAGRMLRAELERRSGVQALGPIVTVGVE
jgi:protease-4